MFGFRCRDSGSVTAETQRRLGAITLARHAGRAARPGAGQRRAASMASASTASRCCPGGRRAASAARPHRLCPGCRAHRSARSLRCRAARQPRRLAGAAAGRQAPPRRCVGRCACRCAARTGRMGRHSASSTVRADTFRQPGGQPPRRSIKPPKAAPPSMCGCRRCSGWRSTPMLAAGRVPLTLRLTSPAGRPIQVTRDLPRFWAGSWADVRRDLRGRYPQTPLARRPGQRPADPARQTAGTDGVSGKRHQRGQS